MDNDNTAERRSRGVYLVTMVLAAFCCGAYTTTRHAARSGQAPSQLDGAFSGDAGTGVPAFVLLPASTAGLHVCDGLSCPFPGPEPGEEAHRCVTYIADDGRSITLDKNALGASSCNATSTVLAHEYGQYLIEIEGEDLERLDHEVRLGEIGRVVACTLEPTDADGSVGAGYAVSHVRVLQPTPFHFDAKSGAFVADEN